MHSILSITSDCSSSQSTPRLSHLVQTETYAPLYMIALATGPHDHGFGITHLILSVRAPLICVKSTRATA